MTQQRAIETRAALISGAATEFARYGYAAASINRLLRNVACTKGAMYFHFESKKSLGEAVLADAAAIYTTIATRWSAVAVHPLDALSGLVDDAAQAYITEPALRAETRLSREPDFLHQRPLEAWQSTATQLAEQAAELGCFRDGFTADRFVRSLMVSLAGYRLLASVVPTDVAASIPGDYTEALEIVSAAAGCEAARTPGIAMSPIGGQETIPATDREQSLSGGGQDDHGVVAAHSQ